MFSLETVIFYCKKILQLIYYICGLLGYWESKNNHSWIEGDNKFKSPSCQVMNNMETTLNINDFKFHKPGKWRSKNWLENWFI